MPQMNTPIRTFVMRIAFLLLAALPTCGMLGYLAIVSLQSAEMSAEAWSLLLSERTGLEIQIGRMERTASGDFLLENFEIGDPESGTIWISAPSVMAALSSNGLLMKTSGAALRASALRTLNEHLEQRVLKARRQGFLPMAIVAKDCSLVLSDKDAPPLPIPELTLTTRIETDGPELRVEAKIIEDGANVMVSLDARRVRFGNQASTTHQWKIGGEIGLSTRTLVEFSPEWQKLGPRAKFRGSVEIGANHSEYVLKEIQIEEIDIGILGADLGLDGMTGIAAIGGQRLGEIEKGAQAHMVRGQLTDLFGELRVQAGRCDRIMFDRLKQAIGFEVVEGAVKSQGVRFDEFAVLVQLIDENLQFQALLDDPGTLMKNGDRDIARLNTRMKRRNARVVLACLFSDTHSETPAAVQWMAAMPDAPSGGSPAASTARRGSKIR
jgi:hypothetical protein